MAKEQSQAAHVMGGLPPKEEKAKDGDGTDSSDSKQIRLDPYRVFDRYFFTDDRKGKAKDKGELAWIKFSNCPFVRS